MIRSLKKPGLPPGALRELNEALHELHLRAGWPTCPDMAQESAYSKSRIHAVFSSMDLPSLKVVRELAHGLAQLADQDPEEEVSRFHELWISAAREDSVVRGGEGPPLQPTLGGGLPSAREPQRADGSSTPLPQGDSPPAESGAATANLEPYRADWSDIFESALSAVLLSLFPQKSRAYQFLDEAGMHSDYYVAGDPSTIGYWANIVEYVRSKSSMEGLERLIESAAQNSEGDQEQLRKLRQALRDMAPD